MTEYHVDHNVPLLGTATVYCTICIMQMNYRKAALFSAGLGVCSGISGGQGKAEREVTGGKGGKDYTDR